MNKITNFLCLSLLLLGAIVLGMNPSFASPLASEGRLIGGTWQDEQLGQELLSAAKRGYFKVVERLIAQGASVEAKDNHGWGPLSWAAYNDHAAMCRLLIANNVSVEAKNNYGQTSLICAACNGHKAICRLLIENKALVEAKDNYGRTPLSWAATNGYKDVCRLLIEHKSSVEAKDNYGWTPLMRAAWSGREGVCKLLIDVQLEEARENKAAIATFLGVARKRPGNLPCKIQKDIAQMIARQAFESVQQDKQSVIAQIRCDNQRTKENVLVYVNQQMNSVNK
jgi:ankyrin repeat protein